MPSKEERLYNSQLTNAYEQAEVFMNSLGEIASHRVESEAVVDLLDMSREPLQDLVNMALFIDKDTIVVQECEGYNPNETETFDLGVISIEHNPDEDALRLTLSDFEKPLEVTEWVSMEDQEIAISIAKGLRILADQLERKIVLSKKEE